MRRIWPDRYSRLVSILFLVALFLSITASTAQAVGRNALFFPVLHKDYAGPAGAIQRTREKPTPAPDCDLDQQTPVATDAYTCPGFGYVTETPVTPYPTAATTTPEMTRTPYP